MNLKEIQSVVVRLDAIENILKGFDAMAQIVKDGGGMGRIEIDIKVKADPRDADKQRGFGSPWYDYGNEPAVQDYHRSGWFGVARDADKQKEPVYKSKMEIKPNDVETLRVLAIFVERLLKEKAQLQEQLKALGMEITSPNTK